MAKAKQAQAESVVDDLEMETAEGPAPGGVAPIGGGDSSADAVAALLATEVQAEEEEEAMHSGDGEPRPGGPDATDEEARLAGAQFMANMLTGAGAEGVRQAWGVEVSKSDQDKVAEKLAPVMAKYGGGMPSWLVPYKEEFELGVVLAGVGVGVYRQVQQRKAEAASAVNDDGAQQKAAA